MLFVPDSSTRAYWKTHPTLVASEPISVFTPWGRLPWIFERYSRTRERAQ